VSVEGGIWSSPREGDGIARLRVVERTSGRLRLLGRIWLISDQGQEPFWLELTEERDRIHWTLHFGLMSFGQRRDLRDVVDLMTAPEEGAWRVRLDGTAVLEAGELRAVELTPSA
jgi:hypothetical protein